MLTEILISNSFAQDAVNAGAASQESGIASFVPLIAIFVIFYFLIIRPQSKKMKDHQQMVNNLKKGDKVVTSGGILAVVSSVNEKDANIEIEIADGVVVKVVKNHIIEIVKPQEEKQSKEKKSKSKSK